MILVVAVTLTVGVSSASAGIGFDSYPTSWSGPYTPYTNWVGQHNTNTYVEITGYMYSTGPAGYTYGQLNVWVDEGQNGHFTAPHPNYFLHNYNSYTWRIKEIDVVTGNVVSSSESQNFSISLP